MFDNAKFMALALADKDEFNDQFDAFSEEDRSEFVKMIAVMMYVTAMGIREMDVDDQRAAIMNIVEQLDPEQWQNFCTLAASLDFEGLDMP